MRSHVQSVSNVLAARRRSHSSVHPFGYLCLSATLEGHLSGGNCAFCPLAFGRSSWFCFVCSYYFLVLSLGSGESTICSVLVNTGDFRYSLMLVWSLSGDFSIFIGGQSLSLSLFLFHFSLWGGRRRMKLQSPTFTQMGSLCLFVCPGVSVITSVYVRAWTLVLKRYRHQVYG